MYIIGAFLAFSILILGHEFGHFIIAKKNDVNVEEFSIGMGPKLFGIQGKETLYSIRILPIGGYVKMLGEEEKSNDSRSFSQKTPAQKLAIVAAGPIMNFILAIIFFAIIGFMKGYVVPIVGDVEINSPAYIMGIQKGDKIEKVDNKNITSWDEFVTTLALGKGKDVDIQIKRGNESKVFHIKPSKDPKENRFIIGVNGTYKKPNVIEAIGYGVKETASMIKMTVSFFGTLFKGHISAQDVGGPVSIIKISTVYAKAGFLSLLWFTAYLSVQLGFLNIIPFPALDGGWILLLLIQIITGKKFDDNKVGILNYIGFALLMLLMVAVTIKDFVYPINF